VSTAVLVERRLTHKSRQGADTMNWDQVEGNWKQLAGKVRSKWGKLTDDDVELIGGKKDTLVGKLQERYGRQRDDVETEVDTWLRSLS
jgi:uncharacterized protein YjbJ (UPF0337 family)